MILSAPNCASNQTSPLQKELSCATTTLVATSAANDLISAAAPLSTSYKFLTDVVFWSEVAGDSTTSRWVG